MIKAVTITNYLGDSLRLELMSPEKSGLIIKEITGLGPSDANINVTDISTNDGSLYNSSRLQKRNIVITLAFMVCPACHTIEEARLKTYKYFPIKKRINFMIETDNRKADIIGYVESNEPQIFDKEERTQISIICPDPYFYSAGETGKTTTVFSGLVSLFEFPFENNSLTEKLIEFGDIQRLAEQTIYYQGDAEVGVTIKMHALGPVGDITIYNTGTREIMKIDAVKLEELTGYGIITSDDIIISTIKGKKTITLLRNGVETNILNCLDKNVDWFQLAKGDNVFTYTATTGSTNLQFEVINRVVYEGV